MDLLHNINSILVRDIEIWERRCMCMDVQYKPHKMCCIIFTEHKMKAQISQNKQLSETQKYSYIPD